MSRENLISIILAGGIGTRIKHKTPKVLLKIKDKTLIGTSINLAEIFSDKINIVINKYIGCLFVVGLGGGRIDR